MPRRNPTPAWQPYAIFGGAALAAVGVAWIFARGGRGGSGTIFTIVMENRGYDEIIGNPQMPYLNQLANTYANLTNYHANQHPSLPAYLVMTSGQTWGVTDDGYHLIPGNENIFAQMDAARVSWRAYAESMGRPCRTTDTNLYASRHNPSVYYQSVLANQNACSQKVVDLSQLSADLANPPKYVWITPNLQHDIHDGTRAQGDAWLSQVIPQIMASPGYQRGGVIFILFDESYQGSRLPAVVISESLRGRQDATAYDHRSYLAGVQDLLGIGRLPATQDVTSMAGMFR